MNILQLYLLIIIIGASTYFVRVLYFVLDIDFTRNEIVKRGLEVVAPSMLVALVLPFTFFEDQQLEILRPQVYAIILSIPIIFKSKKFGYGLIICLVLYYLILLLIP